MNSHFRYFLYYFCTGSSEANSGAISGANWIDTQISRLQTSNLTLLWFHLKTSFNMRPPVTEWYCRFVLKLQVTRNYKDFAIVMPRPLTHFSSAGGKVSPCCSTTFPTQFCFMFSFSRQSSLPPGLTKCASPDSCLEYWFRFRYYNSISRIASKFSKNSLCILIFFIQQISHCFI